MGATAAHLIRNWLQPSVRTWQGTNVPTSQVIIAKCLHRTCTRIVFPTMIELISLSAVATVQSVARLTTGGAFPPAVAIQNADLVVAPPAVATVVVSV